MSLPATIPARDLKLADVIKLFEGPWGYAVVKQITDDRVILFRPYAQTADFSYTGGVICYVGIEENCSLCRDDSLYQVFERRDLK